MNDSIKSCQVSLYRDGNLATYKCEYSTSMVTSEATQDLFALSTRVLERNKGNILGSSMTSKQLPINTPIETEQKNELKQLIRKVGIYYKATDSETNAMFEETLQYHPLDVALMTFHNLMAEIKEVQS